MNLGIDIDGVMTNFEAFGTEYAARWQYFHKMPIIYKPFYKLYYAFGFSRHPDTASMSTDEKNIFEQFYKEILYEYTQNCPVRSTWPEVLQSLKENGHKIFWMRYPAISELRQSVFMLDIMNIIGLKTELEVLTSLRRLRPPFIFIIH